MGLGAQFGRKPAKNKIKIIICITYLSWLCLKLFLIFPLARGVPGKGPDCNFPEGIVGFGPIPARIRGFLIFILAVSTARFMLFPDYGRLCLDEGFLLGVFQGRAE